MLRCINHILQDDLAIPLGMDKKWLETTWLVGNLIFVLS